MLGVGTKGRAVSSLPIPATALIGQDRYVSAVTAALRTDRLVTITGSGGIGTTRVALEVARLLDDEFAAGARSVDLSAVRDPQVVPSTVLAAIGGREDAGREILDLLAGFITAPMLIVLDNCEHLIGACAELVESLLARNEWVTVLITSREPWIGRRNRLAPALARWRGRPGTLHCSGTPDPAGVEPFVREPRLVQADLPTLGRHPIGHRVGRSALPADEPGKDRELNNPNRFTRTRTPAEHSKMKVGTAMPDNASPREVVEDDFDRLSRRDESAFDLVAEEFIQHAAAAQGRNGLRQIAIAIDSHLGQPQIVINHVVASDDMVCIHLDLVGTHVGSSIPLLIGPAVPRSMVDPTGSAGSRS